MNIQLQTIESKIYTLRGQKVMLDFDLAEIYGTQTKRLKEAVRRNSRRFPMDFMFELTNDEWQSLRSQIASSKRGGIRYAPFAFTEWGVAMLSSVINTDVSIEINIGIMKAFVAVRQMLVSRPADKIEELREYVEEIVADQNDINEDTRMQLELINQTLAGMQAGKQTDNTPRRRVGY
jgi:argonaute-like protein implicated in RNA metabolism and viral defense